MSKKYVDDKNLQIAMTEYQKNIGEIKNYEVKDQYDRNIGYVSKVYDNEHGSGEQVYLAILLSHLIYVIL